VKPAPFEYRVASSLAHAVELIDDGADEAKVLAGGQSLVPLMNLRRITPSLIIDISRCREGSGVRDDGDALLVGALATYRSLEESDLVATHCGLLVEALRYVGSPAVRNRGTIGGSLSHADPTAEPPTVVAALEGELTVIGPGGRRQSAFGEFCIGPFQVALARAELVSEVRLPKLPASAGWGFAEVSRRYGSSAQMAAAAAITIDRDRVSAAWISVAGLASVPTKAREAEKRLRENVPTEEAFAAAALAAVEELAGPDEEPYRRQLARVLVRRALEQSRRTAARQ
jgi:aerobic carbon-monoxide dehydrogenase medium subunit